MGITNNDPITIEKPLDPDEPSIFIKSETELFDPKKFGWGIAALLIYAVLSFYLLRSREIKRFLDHHRHEE